MTILCDLSSAEMLIFVYESNKDRKAARRKYGWGFLIRFTFIGVTDCFGFLHEACDEVLHMYKEKEEHQPVDANRFV